MATNFVNFMTSISDKSLYILFLSVVVLSAAIFLFRRSKDEKSSIFLDDLLLGEDNRISKTAVAYFVSLGLTTWVIVYLTTIDKLTEGYFGLYMTGWVTPLVMKIVFNKSSPIKTVPDEADSVDGK